MNRAAYLPLALGLLACAPTQPQATEGCQSLADCALNEVCDVPARTCMAEPADRVLGAFSCTVDDQDKLEPSEVIGRVGKNRWSLPTALCKLDGKDDANFTLLAFGYSSGTIFQVRAPVRELEDGRAELGLYQGIQGVSAASIVDVDIYTAYGYSRSGFLTLSERPVSGRTLTGYVDVDMYATINRRGVTDDAVFGVPCPRGRADCGEKTADIGGAEFCDVMLDTPMCSRLCETDGDCALGRGKCVLSACTIPCATNRDCTAPLECVAGKEGEGSGCF